MIETVLALVKRFPIWIAIGVFALGGYLLRDYLSGSAGDLKVGDCFDVPSFETQSATVKDVQHHPCSELHSGEVFFLENVPATPTPRIRPTRRSTPSRTIDACRRTAATPGETSIAMRPTTSNT